jgi:DNA-binding beta-propeller fold protein YncE
MKREMLAKIAIVGWIATIGTGNALSQGPAPQGPGMPQFELDPAWPKVPAQWKLGDVSSVTIDRDDRVLLLQRPQGDGLVPAAQRSTVAPPVLEFDSTGKFIQAWGGPGNGYQWPEREHGIYIDHKDNVWIGGNYCKERNFPQRKPVSDDQVLKFTRSGKFLLQIGKSNGSKGNSDTANLHNPSDAFVYAKTNEVFVADGYMNHRVIVFDADTGAFKRMWGGFGNKPIDAEQCPPDARPLQPLANDGTPGPAQLDVVHAARVSNDGLVYVADRQNNRVQVFSIDGKYVTQVFVGRDTPQVRRTASCVALSTDPQQQYLFVAGNQRIAVLDRKTLKLLGTFAGNGVHHHVALDSKGNLYSARLGTGKNIEKYVFKGTAPSATR